MEYGLYIFPSKKTYISVFKRKGNGSVVFFGSGLTSVKVSFWPIFILFKKYRAHRKPMLLFEFVGELFRFSVNTPALAPLFQLPPRLKACALYRPYPSRKIRGAISFIIIKKRNCSLYFNYKF